jgi:hypothetical protein
MVYCGGDCIVASCYWNLQRLRFDGKRLDTKKGGLRESS